MRERRSVAAMNLETVGDSAETRDKSQRESGRTIRDCRSAFEAQVNAQAETAHGRRPRSRIPYHFGTLS